MYTGKNEERGQVSLGQHITLKLTEPLVDSGRNVTTDIFFTSLDCARQLRAHGLTMLGTVRRHLRFVPDKMRCVGKRELYSTDFRFSEADRTALMLYVAKKSKPVLILSTLHNNTAVSDTQTKKPLAILDYNI